MTIQYCDYNTLHTRVEEEYSLEAGQLYTIHIEVIKPVGQLIENPEQHSSYFRIIDVVLAAGETAGEQDSVRFWSVLGSQLESAMLAPARL